MAQYWTNFSEHTADAQPSDWTERWYAADGTVIARSGSATAELGAQYLELATTANSKYSVSWDDIDGDAGKDDAEALVRFKVQGSLSIYPLLIHLRGSGSDGSGSAYGLGFYYGSTLAIRREVNGSVTTLATGSLDLDLDTYHWARFRVNGSTLQAKAWPDGQPEPSAWQLETTDANVTSGWVGANLTRSASTVIVDYFAVGTGGDTAPEPEVDPTVEARVTYTYTEALTQDTSVVEARATQTYVEALSQDTTPVEARITQAYVEVLRPPPPQFSRILVDFTTETSPPDVEPWNRLVDSTISHSLLDIDGVETGVTLVPEHTFSGTSLTGLAAEEEVYHGWPRQVWDSAWADNTAGEQLYFTLSGLPAGKAFDLRIAGHRGTSSRDTIYRVTDANGERLVTYDDSGSTTPNLQAWVRGVVPPSGELKIYATARSTWMYFSAFDLRLRDPEPETLARIALSDTAKNPSGWNELTGQATGTRIADLLDDAGSSTGYALEQDQGFTGPVNNLAAAGDHHGWPHDVWDEGWYLVATNFVQVFSLTGLPPGHAFTLRFSGHRGTSGRNTMFRADAADGQAIAFYEDSGSTTPSRQTELSGVVPDDGVLPLWVENAGYSYSYFGGFSISVSSEEVQLEDVLPVGAARISQSATETLVTDNPTLYATQSATETLITDSPMMYVTQSVVEVLIPFNVEEESGPRGYIFIAT